MRSAGARRLLVGAVIVLGTLVGYWMLLDRTSLPSRDQVDFYLRTHEYAAEWRAGHWAQDLPDVLGGGGHAFPRFYPPLPHWIAALAYLVLGDVVVAGHAALILAIVLGGWGAAWFVAEVSGSLVAGLVGGLLAIARMYVPVVIFFRGAFSEAWTFVWYPLLLLGIWRLARGERLPRWWAFAALALVLSHTVMAAWTLPPIVILGLLASPDGRARSTLLRDAGLAAAMSAFFVVPMLWYKGDARVADPALMGSTPRQMVTALAEARWPWPLGLLEVLVLAACGWAWWRRRPVSPVGRALLLLVAGQAFYYAGATAPEAVWRLVPQPLRYVQFPLRLHGPGGLLLALALGVWSAGRGPRVRAALGAAGAALLVMWAAIVPTVPWEPVAAPLTHAELLKMLHGAYADRGLTIQTEYLPRHSCPSLVASIDTARRRLVGGDAPVTWRSLGPGSMQLPPGTRGATRLPLVAYDFHRIRDDAGRELSTRSDCGQLVVDVGENTRALHLERRLPPPLAWGMAVSALALLAFVALGGRQLPSRRT